MARAVVDFLSDQYRLSLECQQGGFCGDVGTEALTPSCPAVRKDQGALTCIQELTSLTTYTEWERLIQLSGGKGTKHGLEIAAPVAATALAALNRSLRDRDWSDAVLTGNNPNDLNNPNNPNNPNNLNNPNSDRCRAGPCKSPRH